MKNRERPDPAAEARGSALSRRALLRQSLLCGGVLISGLHKLAALLATAQNSPDPFHGGKRICLIPFSDESNPPMGQAIGAELDGRLFTDLSQLTPENPITSVSNFYIRTRASKLLNTTSPWTIQLGGLVDKPLSINAETLAKTARPMGIHLMECVGNTRNAHFGMLSAAEWDGVPLHEVLATLKSKTTNARVLVSGFDHYVSESRTSLPGASWIFTPGDLQSSRAFLATKMNGQPLTADHGAPVRLVVPGWYGCACIKWVNELQFVPADAPATSQMQEYAGRTRQNGMPELARDYLPAGMDIAALPIRIEKWSVDGKIKFRVVGIQWGGTAPINGLEISFGPGEPFFSVEDFRKSTLDSWNLWSHAWTPAKPGKYLITLQLKDRSMTARRLDSGYYARSVEISQL
jgi:DMSO/TMAO reductase YedYZ molybdopterin-dependent catalytic subunit